MKQICKHCDGSGPAEETKPSPVLTESQEISELKDHCNYVWQLIKPLLPMCPSTTRIMLAKAMEDAKTLRGEGSSKLERTEKKLGEALEAIRGAMRIKELWIYPEDYQAEGHDGEVDALISMEQNFKAILKANKEGSDDL